MSEILRLATWLGYNRKKLVRCLRTSPTTSGRCALVAGSYTFKLMIISSKYLQCTGSVNEEVGQLQRRGQLAVSACGLTGSAARCGAAGRWPAAAPAPGAAARAARGERVRPHRQCSAVWCSRSVASCCASARRSGAGSSR
ncbi:hypothetical protein ACJJTC_016711 [Scirpophaga incertulas]